MSMIQPVLNTLYDVARNVYPLIGSGDKLEIDRVATEAIRKGLSNINGCVFRVDVSEYEKDNSYGLHIGETVGYETYFANRFGLAVDPIEGTTRTSKGLNNAMTILAMSDSFYKSESHYAKKLYIAGRLFQELLPKEEKALGNKDYFDNVPKIVDALEYLLRRKPKVVVLDRPRNQKLIDELRKQNLCNLNLIEDCDILPCLQHDVDIYAGIGGFTEGILAACTAKCSNGYFFMQECDKEGNSNSPILSKNELINGDVDVFIVGITDSSVLRGVEFLNGKFCYDSLFMNNKGLFLKQYVVSSKN